ncbi:SRPBCC domain-containing protein [Chitinophaga alhagiae]|uniref:SRPBCC domain-containing protein n=1 Tax=Chitinophaga alhagiae TaxID=2203219 RepID=UPI000E5AE3FD|nr:SRPBCC domain-containing protein [Chitinophaga alhagiae]
MKKLHFNTTINAPREKVWDILWGKTSYPKWTRPFNEGSDVETDWQEGSDVKFIDADGNGMLSVIAVKREPEYLSFQHRGYIMNGKTDTESPEVKAWAGAEENYTLSTANGQTTLKVDLDVTAEHSDIFGDMFPKALAIVKELSEQ